MAGSEGVRPITRGKVWLVGAGPGDPDLLTVRAARIIAGARILAYDELVPLAVLDLAPRDAERIAVGRRGRGCRHHDGRIHPAIVERALSGSDVVRVKSGDPYIFGRGGEEAEELDAVRIPFEVVPGVSAALGAAASARVPLTHRDVASSVTFATAHLKGPEDDGAAFVASLPSQGTIVLYMGLGTIDQTLSALATVRGSGTPAVAVARATWKDEQIVFGTLGTLATRARDAGLQAPAIVILGEAVARAIPVGSSQSSATRADLARLIPLAIAL